MEEYHWPGNVRELRNVVERAVALGSGPLLDAGDVWLSPLETGIPSAPPLEASTLPLPLAEIEKRHIDGVLKLTDWDKDLAVGILDIERSTLDRKIKLYGLNKGPVASRPTILDVLSDLVPTLPPGLSATEFTTQWPTGEPPAVKDVIRVLNDRWESEGWKRSGTGRKNDPYRYWRTEQKE
jgi:hypothetical protein